MRDPRHIVTTMAIVTNASEQILLVRTHTYGWMPPGGQVEEGEDLITAVKREVFEESGCHIEIERLAGVQSSLSHPTKIHFVFRGHYLSGDLTPSEETPEVRWATYEKALELITRSDFRDKLCDAMQEHGVQFRSYQRDPYRVRLERRI